MEKNIVETVVIPEIPKVISSQELFVYVPIATNEQKGIASFDILSLDVINGKVSVKDSYISNLIDIDQGLKDRFAKKQDIQANELNTDAKTIVGAINENHEKIKKADDIVGKFNGRITQNENDIADLKDASVSGKRYIGSITKNELPLYTDETGYTSEFLAELNALANDNPAQGDYVELYISNVETDKLNLYIITYTNKWNKYDLQAPIAKSNNDRFGLIKGTLNDTGADVLVDIADGKIVDMYVKSTVFGDNPSYQKISSTVSELSKRITSIINGSTQVGIAKQAISDEDGHRIVLTYAKVDDVYTKGESDLRYLPMSFLKVYYIVNPENPSLEGIVETMPTKETPQFTITTNTILDNLVFDVFRRVTGTYNFTKDSTDKCVIWLTTDKNCTLDFRLTTYAVINGETKLLSTDLSGQTSFVKNVHKALTFNTNYGALGGSSITVGKGALLYKKLEVLAPDSNPYTVSVWSNETFTSTFNLSAEGLTYDIHSLTGKKEIDIAASEWVEVDGQYVATVPQVRHGQIPTNQYGLDLQVKLNEDSVQRIPCSFVISRNGDITITSDYNYDCILLIWTSTLESDKLTLTLTNPTVINDVNFNDYGGISIIQTEVATPLTLPEPAVKNKSYRLFVSNVKYSTENITVESEVLKPSEGLEFVWSGNSWSKVTNVSNTTGIFDDVNGQQLNDTIKNYNIKLSVLTLGNKPLDKEFDITNAELLFNEYPIIVNVQVSNFIVNLYRSDMGLNKDKAYFSTVMNYNDTQYTLTLMVTKDTKKGILHQTEEPDNKSLLDYCNSLDATKAGKDIVQQNTNNISRLGGSKQNCEIDKVAGSINVTSMEDFRTQAYELRKDPTRTYQLEVSSSVNIDLMDVLGWPEGNGQSAFIYINLPYSEAGGFEIDITYMGRNGSPIYKRVMTSTLNANWKDTGWYSLQNLMTAVENNTTEISKKLTASLDFLNYADNKRIDIDKDNLSIYINAYSIGNVELHLKDKVVILKGTQIIITKYYKFLSTLEITAAGNKVNSYENVTSDSYLINKEVSGNYIKFGG